MNETVNAAAKAPDATETRGLHANRTRRAAQAALFALVPLAGAAELVAGELQHRAVPLWSDWTRAAEAAKAAHKAGDAVIVAPRWAAPLGRMALDGQRLSKGKRPLDRGDDAIDVRTAARSDLETYPRVLELSIRGKDDPDVAGFRLASEQRFGAVALRTFENPAPQKLVRDLADEIDGTTTVYRMLAGDRKEACRWETGASQKMPALFAGPVPPAARWLCSPFDPGWTFVGTTVITDLSYTPRRCIYMHPNMDSTTTIEFPARPIGKKVVGHVGLDVFAEREMKGAPVLARVSVGGKSVAEVRHVDGEGWKRFEGSTADLAGQRLPVKLELWAEHGQAQMRVACMAVELRE